MTPKNVQLSPDPAVAGKPIDVHVPGTACAHQAPSVASAYAFSRFSFLLITPDASPVQLLTFKTETSRSPWATAERQST